MPCVDLDRSPRNLALGVPGPDGVSLQRSGYRHGQGLAGINASALSTSPAPPQAISHNAYYVKADWAWGARLVRWWLAWKLQRPQVLSAPIPGQQPRYPSPMPGLW